MGFLFLYFFKKKKSSNIADRTFSCGERGIRTPGTLLYAGFQDQCIRPLCHLSKRGRKNKNIFKYGVSFIIFFRAIFLIVFCYLAIQFLRLKNIILNTLFHLISLLPILSLYLLSDFLYLIVYKIIGYRKNVVFTNLQNSFPNKTGEEVKEIQNRFYRHFFDVIVESIKSISTSESFLRNKVVFKNIEMFDK